MTFDFEPLSESSDRPAYKQIADQLRKGIESGQLGPGFILPSERELMDGYGVARGTARQAIATLRTEGLIVTERGRGAIVRERPPVRRLAHERFSSNRKTGQSAYLADIEDLGRTPRVEIINIGKVDASEDISKLLSLRKSDALLERSRKYFADDTPMQIARTYIPWRIAKGTQMVEQDTGAGGLYARLEDAGHKVARYVEEVTSRPALADEAASLRLPAGIPVLVIHRVAYDQEEQAVEYSEIVMASDRYVLSYETKLS
jgi:GntR family transcriptional regulator